MRLVSFVPSLLVSRPAAAFAVALVATAIAPALPAVAPPAVAAQSAARSPTPNADLDRWFAALAAAPDDATASAARTRIEATWQASGSATADLLMTRAATAAHGGDAGLALDLLDAAIVVAPTWAGGRHRRALLHLSRHDMNRAMADIEATLRLEPRHFGAMVMLAAIHDGEGRKKEALALLRRVATYDPRAPGLSKHIERLTLEVEGREL